MVSSYDYPWQRSYPEGVPVTVDHQRYQNVAAIFEESFQKYANEIAYTCMGRDLLFRELEERSCALAGYFQEIGLAKGDRVAVMLPNILQSPITVTAALRAGLVVVNVNPLYTPRELKLQLHDSGAKAIVLLNTAGDRLQEIVGDTDVQHIILTGLGDLHEGVRGAAINAYMRYVKMAIPRFHLPDAVSFKRALDQGQRTRFNLPRIDPDDLAVLQYTGGTTGSPKGVMLLQRNLVAALLSCDAWLEPALRQRPIDGQLTTVCALPLYHVFAFVNSSLIGAFKGAHCLLIPDARNISLLIQALKGRRFHSFAGVNTLFNALMEHPDFTKLDFAELRMSVGGGMEVARTTAERWHEETGCPIAEGYGLTETTSGICCNRLDLGSFTGKLGLPMPGAEVRILDDAGEVVPVGASGEISIRGMSVMHGYWNQPEATREIVTEDGFLRSGDLGSMDEDGFVTFLGRKKDVIVVSGFMVYPREIEDIVREIDGVTECAAVGTPDNRTGEAVQLFVVSDKVSKDQIERQCQLSLAAYKRPSHISFADALPMTGPGKIDRNALRRSIANDC